MKIPKYVNELLKRRTKLASKLIDVSFELDEWLKKNDVEPPDEDWCDGVEIYANPYAAEKSVRKAIEEKK